VNVVAAAVSREAALLRAAPRGVSFAAMPRPPNERSWLALVLRDVQFWVPVAVLIGGLLVLRWIA
jgi:hypothetical protein